MPTIHWPRKTRELHSHHFDSTIWNDFVFRDDDIIVSTYAKSGTTWTQQILLQILHDGDPDLEVASRSPWLDLRVPPKAVKLPLVEAMSGRRVLKTHLPVDALVYSPKARYLYVGRDARDVVWSLYNHHVNANQAFYDALNLTPGLVGPPIERPTSDIGQYWRDWMDRDGHPFWSYWDNVRSWWALRDLPNLLMVHFSDLKRDLPGQMRRIAAFLDVRVAEHRWQAIETYCSFEWMKQNASKAAPLGGTMWEGGGETFIHKGVNGRWREVLTTQDCVEYEARAVQELGPDCARWLVEGGHHDDTVANAAARRDRVRPARRSAGGANPVSLGAEPGVPSPRATAEIRPLERSRQTQAGERRAPSTTHTTGRRRPRSWSSWSRNERPAQRRPGHPVFAGR